MVRRVDAYHQRPSGPDCIKRLDGHDDQQEQDVVDDFGANDGTNSTIGDDLPKQVSAHLAS